MIRLILLAMVVAGQATAQNQRNAQNLVHLDLAAGKSEGSVSASFTRDWFLGANKKIILGAGIRATAYFGHNIYYATAPAELTSGQKGPQVFFIKNIPGNIDSLLVNHPSVYSFNTQVDIGYRFNKRLSVMFNIDVFGYSFGKRDYADYIHNAHKVTTIAKPTVLNLLLVSDNDLGSLNSQLFAKYYLNDKLDLKGGMSFLFTEYTTIDKVQQIPSPNDRFRKKSLMLMIGMSFKM